MEQCALLPYFTLLGEEDPVVLAKELSFGDPFFQSGRCFEPDPL
jgi:hypothetical protein